MTNARHVSKKIVTLAMVMLFIVLVFPGTRDLWGGVKKETTNEAGMFGVNPAHTFSYSSKAPHCFNRILWRFQSEGPVRSTPVTDETALYVGNDAGLFYAIDLTTGKEKWHFTAQAAVASSPALMNGTLFFADKKGNIYALACDTGKQKWALKTADHVLYKGGWDYFISSPVIFDGTIYIGTGDGSILAIDAKDGKQKWVYATGAPVRSAPSISDGMLFCGNLDGIMTALDISNGKLVWKLKADGNEYFPKGEWIFSPTVMDGLVFAGSRDAKLYAMDAKTGALKWKNEEKSGAWFTGTAGLNGVLFAASSDGHYVKGLEATTGKELWTFKTKGLVFSTPTVADNAVYFGSHDNFLYAVSAQNGTLKWMYDAGAEILSTPVIHDGVIFMGSDDGSVTALSGDNSSTTPCTNLVKAVYFEEKMKPFYFRDGVILSTSLAAAGYEKLNIEGLEKFLKERIADKKPSVIVCASDNFYTDLVFAPEGEKSLIQQFMESGGRIVWVGMFPLNITTNRATGKPEYDEKKLGALLGMDASYYYDLYISHPTLEGTQVGYPSWWMGAYGIDPKKVTRVLGLNETGQAIAWMKNYSGPKGSGLYYLWGMRKLPKDFRFIQLATEFEK